MTLTIILNIAVIVVSIMDAIARIRLSCSGRAYPSKAGFYVNRYWHMFFCLYVLVSPTQPHYFKAAILVLTLAHIAISIREDKKILERGGL